ncbi:SIS domain-containing protein [Streptomyces sp. NBC_00378]|uniref:SIS domain-containing protein n=1 Tax=Streptomyces sp. NBC_00376 TaxID=2975730 RepID=UPI00224ECB18|nr:SIS domain-containing protein [Streptomyces sp. NBC_00376]MCX5112791.1 SIS domain-containing protein [Streptomyces sp. NBC_00378]
MAADAAYRLRALGCVVDAPVDPLTAQFAAAQLPPGAVCLAISHTGATRSTVDTARRARRAGAEVIGLTSYAQSPLSETCTHTLVAGGRTSSSGWKPRPAGSPTSSPWTRSPRLSSPFARPRRNGPSASPPTTPTDLAGWLWVSHAERVTHVPGDRHPETNHRCEV